MKKYRLFIAIQLLLALVGDVHAQETNYIVNCTEPNCGVVIALSGLKLRAQPSFTAKTLAVIPFGEKVERKHPMPDYNEPATDPVFTPDSIAGWWELIQWKDKSGYAFNAFIGNRIYQMTQPFYLLFEDAAYCWEDTYADPSYHYYGVFMAPDSAHLSLKKVRPTFYCNHSEFEGAPVRADEKSPTIFMLASKTPLAEDGPLKSYPSNKCIRSYKPEGGLKNTTVAIPASDWKLEVKSEIVHKEWGESEQNFIILKDKKTGSWQRITDEETWFETAEMVWCGDLDRDGVTDFILRIAGDHQVGHILYLSRNPGKGRLIRQAGKYFGGDCC